MIIKTAEFVTSNTEVAKCPKTGLPEFAFIGRSNVGKSSLINMLVSSKSLAKTSSQPGKTQVINHFIINTKWYLVDLPGYGYAKVSQEKRGIWKKFIENYVLNREVLQCLFILIDSRLPPQKIDLEFLTLIGNAGIPFAVIFTKTDKVKSLALSRNVETFLASLREIFDPLPTYFQSSAVEKIGQKEILKFIDTVMKSLKETEVNSEN